MNQHETPPSSFSLRKDPHIVMGFQEHMREVQFIAYLTIAIFVTIMVIAMTIRNMALYIGWINQGALPPWFLYITILVVMLFLAYICYHNSLAWEYLGYSFLLVFWSLVFFRVRFDRTTAMFLAFFLLVVTIIIVARTYQKSGFSRVGNLAGVLVLLGWTIFLLWWSCTVPLFEHPTKKED